MEKLGSDENEEKNRGNYGLKDEKSRKGGERDRRR